MINSQETIEIINAIDKKYHGKDKLSFLSTNDTFNIYKKNKRLTVSAREMLKVINLNAKLLNQKRDQFDLITEYILNRLFKNEKPFPDLKESSEGECKESEFYLA